MSKKNRNVIKRNLLCALYYFVTVVYCRLSLPRVYFQLDV